MKTVVIYGFIGLVLLSFACKSEDWFILNDVPLEYNCSCESKLSSDTIETLYLINLSEVERVKEFSLLDFNREKVDGFRLSYNNGVVYDGNSKKEVIFDLNNDTLGIKRKIRGIESFGSEVSLENIFSNDRLGKVLSYKMERVGSINSTYFYKMTLSSQLGVLSFGYYNGFSPYHCKLRLLGDFEKE